MTNRPSSSFRTQLLDQVRDVPRYAARFAVAARLLVSLAAVGAFTHCGGGNTPGEAVAPAAPVTHVPVTHVPPSDATASTATVATAAGATVDPANPVGAAPSQGDESKRAPEAATTTSAASSPSQPAPSRCGGGAVFVAGGSYQRAGAKTTAQVSDLCVDTLETTVADYGACVSAGKCTTTGLDCSAQATWAKPGKEQQPVVCIDYDQANAYCEFEGKRLPTLEEWEWVARGGDEARTYTWGSEPPNDQLCWTGKRRQTESCVVGTHASDKTASGALDMAGNVLEFVTTTGDATRPVRIAKGGAWNGGDAALFTNARLGGFRKEYRCGFLGVRCVATPNP